MDVWKEKDIGGTVKTRSTATMEYSAGCSSTAQAMKSMNCGLWCKEQEIALIHVQHNSILEGKRQA